jgi:tetratricopeptide (TPR) repeat protein
MKGYTMYNENLYEKSMPYIKEKNYEGALTFLNEVIESDPDNVHALYLKGISLEMLEKYEEAIKAFDRADEIGPFVSTHYNKGYCLYQLCEYKNAIISFDKVDIDDLHYVVALQYKGVCYLKLQLYDKALDVADILIEKKPDCPDGYYQKGNALFELGKETEALLYFDKTIELQPTDVMPHIARELCLINLGREYEAQLSLQRVKELDPSFFDRRDEDTAMDMVRNFLQNKISIRHEEGEVGYEIKYPIYRPDGSPFRIYIEADGDGFILSDHSVTYAKLDEDFDLTADGVVKYIKRILDKYGCQKQNKTNAFTIECDSEFIDSSTKLHA